MNLITDYLRNNAIEYQSFFEECPCCEHNVSPKLIDTYKTYDGVDHLSKRFFVLQCNRKVCRRYFIIEVVLEDGFPEPISIVTDYNIYPKNHTNYSDEEIKSFSPRFIEIYNQAKIADEMKLCEVSGPGYRKALEFLLKDYIIFSHKDDYDFDESVVRNSKSVVKLIKGFIDNKKIVSAAERAFWVGNDSTHYEKEWIDLDNEDLKNLIGIVLYHIKLELQMKFYEEKMVRK